MKVLSLQNILTTICLLWFAPVVYAQNNELELGTLFTTPEERVYLDYLREDFLATSQASDFDIDEQIPPIIVISDETEANSSITEFIVGGFLNRRDGNRAAWINGVLINESELPSNMEFISTGTGLSLRIETETASFVLKPGQKLNTLSGQISEAFGLSSTDSLTIPQAGASREADIIAIPIANQEPANTQASGADSISQEEALEALIRNTSPEEIAILLENLQAIENEQ